MRITLQDQNSEQLDIRRFGTDKMALPLDQLTPASRGALSQFTMQRLTAYGATWADANLLRTRTAAGESWLEAGLDIAEGIIGTLGPEASEASRINALFRASAMVRMAQMMMVVDTDERRGLFERASALYHEAARRARDRFPFKLETQGGTIAGWVHPAKGERVGLVVTLGGIEGWSMDLADLARWHTERGMEVWAIDGPGQGESRLVHRHYLTEAWRETYDEVLDHVRTAAEGLPVGISGMSMGATFALEIAARTPWLAGCCANGGPGSGATLLGQQEAKVPKKRMMCGPEATPQFTDHVWSAIELTRVGPRVTCPVLLVHGGRDPLIRDEEMEEVFASIGSVDKRMLVFEDGDHCIYNHADDRYNAKADWMRSKLLNEST